MFETNDLHNEGEKQTVHTQLNKDSKQLGTPSPKIAEQTPPQFERIQLAQQNKIPPHAKLLLE